MNVYDFDKTIYANDCSVDFYLYNLKKDFTLIRYFPSQLKAFIDCYVFKRIDITQMKQTFYCYLQSIENIDQRVNEFWDINLNKINKWYLQQKNENDVIISASPYFLVNEAARRLNVKRVIASNVDENGNYNGSNCRGEEKVRRFIETGFNKDDVDAFYSDSQNDLPFAKFSKKAFLVKKENVRKWRI